ncbi:hypothetical protein [Pedobacter sp. NJ-S-72]
MKIALRLVLCLTCLLLFAAKTFSQQHLKNNDFLKVDSLANKQKPKEALALINSLNKQARKEGNTILLIKSAMYRTMFQSYLEEDAFTKILVDLRDDIHAAKQPEKSVLQSLLAETYWEFYQQNRYKIYQRTKVQTNIGNDINTWSIGKITDEIVKTLISSLSEKKLLQDTKIGDLNNVLLGDTSTRYLRPSLYDLLAHRALKILTNSQIDLAKTTDDGFDLNNPQLFADHKMFSALKINVSDSTILIAEQINIFQNLLKYHSGHHNDAALADADLKRLKFVYEKSTNLNKEEYYLKAIDLLAAQAIHTEIYADILYEQALYYKKDQNGNKPDLVKSVELADKAIRAFPKSNGAKNAANLIKEINSKSLHIQLKEFSHPGQPSQLYFTYKNIDTIQLQLYKVPVTFNEYNFNEDEKYKDFLKTHKPIKSWNEVLPKSVDYQQHTLIGKMDALPYGNYIVIVQNTIDTGKADRIVQHSNFSVTSMAVTQRFLSMIKMNTL